MQPWLIQQFNENGWQERLASCKKAKIHDSLTPPEKGLPKGTMTIGYEYYDTDSTRVAIMLQYVHPELDNKPTPKGLLIDGVWCYV